MREQRRRRNGFGSTWVFLLLAVGFLPRVGAADEQGRVLTTGKSIYWLNHFDLLAGAREVRTFHDSTSSGVGGGLTGVVIRSYTAGDKFLDGGNKVVHMAVESAPGSQIR